MTTDMTSSTEAGARRVPSPVKAAVPADGAPGLLQEWVRATGTTAAAAARSLRISRQHLDRILSEDLRITPEMAMRLGKWSGTNPVDWLARQAHRDVQRLHSDKAFLAALQDVRPWHKAE